MCESETPRCNMALYSEAVVVGIIGKNLVILAEEKLCLGKYVIWQKVCLFMLKAELAFGLIVVENKIQQLITKCNQMFCLVTDFISYNAVRSSSGIVFSTV